MYFFYIVVYCLFLFGLVTANSDKPPEVSTPLGKVQGQWKTSYDGRRYAAFEGVPYAEPPIGHLRFQESQPIEPWLGIWNATQLYSCIQNSLDLSETSGEEDCLYINVYIPQTNQRNLDVVVHIHGGCFMFGSGSSFVDAKYVTDRDLIFVTFNYRLGALGFLSTGDEILPGNNGLKDQVLALKWVQQNIASFGGNPNSVTITGFSAGGGSVHLHYLSPLSKGLFHRGMSLSGVSTAFWVTRENTVEETQQLASLVGCDSVYNSEELVECLKTRPASLLVKNTKHMCSFPPAPLCVFNPVIEKTSKNPFLQTQPLKLLQEKKVLDVPWISSVTSSEGLVLSLLFSERLNEMDKRWDEIASDVLDFRDLHYRSDIPNKIKEYYLGEGETFNKNNFDKFTKLATDLFFAIKAESAAKLHSKATKSPVYFYYFNYEGTNSFKDLLTPEKIEGVSHGDDLVYFFGGLISKELSESDIRLKNACLDMLYSYAKYGVPTFKAIDWLPTNGEELTYLNITSPDDIKVQTTNDLTGTRKFWKEIGLLEDDRSFVKNEL